jgi:iron complex outermembrane receptor protein
MKYWMLCVVLALAHQAGAQPPLEEIVVTADFREQPEADVAASVSVLDAATLEEGGVQHFEDVMLLIPNLNWSGETSRPRFLQIRGIGEREQYQGAPNPSVGFIVDDIDFSGIGMVATLFDVDQVEVLRGPQGTRYGANALAGLVNVHTRDPGDTFEMYARTEFGSDNLRSAGLAVGGPLPAESARFRLALQSTRSDGFRDNVFLDRSDTNGRNELTARAKLSVAAGDAWHAELTAMHVDLDNGYDAWANDNGFVTRTDDPGRDAQRSNALAFRQRWSRERGFDLLSITTVADSTIEVSFDGDWGNDAYWGVPYDFTSATDRGRRSWTQELRLLSRPGAELFSGTTSWIAGAYWLSLEESNDVLEVFNGEVFRDLRSDFDADNVAAFAQIDTAMSERTGLSIGVRVERRDARYADSDSIAFSPSESMAGGHIALTHEITSELSWYGALVKGYKAGGFNIGPSIPAARREYGAETLWSLESGIKGGSADGRLSGAIGAFYSARRDQQVSTSLQIDPADPLSFVFFTDNAATGYNYGIEADASLDLGRRWRLDANLGLLRTRYERFESPGVALEGREQAHAPRYQFAVAATYRAPSGFFARIDVQGRDAFYFDDSHDQRSQSYELLHLRAGFEYARWAAAMWVRNLLDEKYAVRGFYFSNDPNDPSFTPQLFTRLGDPRQVGFTASFTF